MTLPWVDVRVSPVYGPMASDWPESVTPGRYERMPMTGAIIAYDLATEKFLKAETNEALREAIWKHRALFIAELERLEQPRSQARPA